MVLGMYIFTGAFLVLAAPCIVKYSVEFIRLMTDRSLYE